MIVDQVRSYLALQEHYGFSFPTFAMLSFCKAAGLKMMDPTELGYGSYDSEPLMDEVVALPELLH